MKFNITTASASETRKVARGFAKTLSGGEVIGLIGELGAGKTCFIAGMAEGLGVPEECYVSSPAFTILKVYDGRLKLYHFDFYRLTRPDEFYGLGFDDYLKGGGVVAVEWADRFLALLPKEIMRIVFEVTGEGRRKIMIGPW